MTRGKMSSESEQLASAVAAIAAGILPTDTPPRVSWAPSATGSELAGRVAMVEVVPGEYSFVVVDRASVRYTATVVLVYVREANDVDVSGHMATLNELMEAVAATLPDYFNIRPKFLGMDMEKLRSSGVFYAEIEIKASKDVVNPWL